MAHQNAAPSWNVKGRGGENKPLHLKQGPPQRKGPPEASHGANVPLHQSMKSGGANKPLHQRVGPPQRSKPPASGKGKTFNGG